VTPTQLSLVHLGRAGYVSEVVETRGRYGRTYDLLGFIDILAFGAGETLAVQTTSADHVSHRVAKIKAEPRARAALDAGWRIHVHGWHPDARLRLVEVVTVRGDLQAVERIATPRKAATA
jgi:hypothetical protein